VPSGASVTIASSSTAGPRATYVRLASTKSMSSVAAQNTGAVGTPVAACTASASARAESALLRV
jgi:hypothetical protein